MSLLTTKNTAKKLQAIISTMGRDPSRAAFGPRLPFQPPLHPWTIRYSKSRGTYIAYIPEGSVAGYTIDFTKLTRATELTDWYNVATATDAVKLYLWLKDDKTVEISWTKPDEHETGAQDPDFECTIAIVTDPITEKTEKVEIKQLVTSALSLGGISPPYWAPGPINIEEIDGDQYLVQRWVRITGGTLEPVPDDGIPDDDESPRMPGGAESDNIYATKILLIAHAKDHATGVVDATES